MTDEELLMYAYYYSFDKTGQVEIDRILSAVACAGKAFHYTGDWNDEATPRTKHEGATPIDWIQNRAKEAADTIEALRAENARLYEWKDKAGDMDRVKTVELVDLRAENARLRKALKPFSDKDLSFQKWCDDGLIVPISVELGSIRSARAAMGETNGDES